MSINFDSSRLSQDPFQCEVYAPSPLPPPFSLFLCAMHRAYANLRFNASCNSTFGRKSVASRVF